MLRLLLLASAICIAFGQSSTTQVHQSSVMTATVPHSATTSTTVAPPAPTGTPEPPTTPPPIPQPSENNYFINNTDGKTVCLHLRGGFSIKINYIGNDNKEMHHLVDFEKSTTKVNGASVCNITAQHVQLKLQYTPSGSQHPFFLTLVFQGHDNKTWNTTGVEVEFTYDESYFPGYIGPKPSNDHISSSTSDDFFEDQPVDLKQSFTCMANRTISGFNPITTHMNVSLFVNDLQVQAFSFVNPTSGAFDAGAVCAQDPKDTGNKVVPIAVGAALAGLVIVVLIAYLIGRLRNRKKSSYEALS